VTWRTLGDHPGLKVLSFAIAVVLWLMAQGEQTHRVTVVAPVHWTLPQELLLLADDPLPDRVVIVASGRRAAVRKALDGRFPYDVDLREVAVGRTVHAFRGSPEGFPAELRIETVSPAMVELHFDEPITRVLPVRLRTRGDLPVGFRETGRDVDPAQVSVVGARRELEVRDSIETSALSLQDRTASFQGRLPLDLRGLHLRPGGTTDVKVRLELAELHGERTLESVAVAVAGASVSPPTASVRLQGPVPVLDALARTGVTLTLRGELEAALGSGGTGVVPWVARPPEGAASIVVDVEHARASEVRVLAVEPATFALARDGQ
jgi:hypothetical protein